MATIEFFFDFTSPYSYLASTQVRRVAERTGARVEAKPFVLGAVFKTTGNSPPALVPAKGAHMLRDIEAWAADYGVPFRLPAQFPVNALKAHRLVLAIEDEEKRWAFIDRVYRAYFGEGHDITDAAVLGELVSSLGLDAPALLARTDTAEIKERLRQITDDAVARGTFGAPTFFVGDQLFVGNDRLHFVERAARGERIYR